MPSGMVHPRQWKHRNLKKKLLKHNQENVGTIISFAIQLQKIFCYLRDPTTLILVCEITPMRKLSNARVKKQANVETNATHRSRQAMPIAT